MRIKLVTTGDAVSLTGGHPYAAGSFALYTAHTAEAKKMRQTKTFGCYHCLPIFQVLKPARGHRSKNSGDRAERLFTFDGVVSHAKEKCVSSLFRP
jgi:hypothetical protein